MGCVGQHWPILPALRQATAVICALKKAYAVHPCNLLLLPHMLPIEASSYDTLSLFSHLIRHMQDSFILPAVLEVQQQNGWSLLPCDLDSSPSLQPQGIVGAEILRGLPASWGNEQPAGTACKKGACRWSECDWCRTCPPARHMSVVGWILTSSPHPGPFFNIF